MMYYAIEWRICERLRVELADGEGVIADVGTLVYRHGAVEWNVVLPGRGVATCHRTRLTVDEAVDLILCDP